MLHFWACHSIITFCKRSLARTVVHLSLLEHGRRVSRNPFCEPPRPSPFSPRPRAAAALPLLRAEPPRVALLVAVEQRLDPLRLLRPAQPVARHDRVEVGRRLDEPLGLDERHVVHVLL